MFNLVGSFSLILFILFSLPSVSFGEESPKQYKLFKIPLKSISKDPTWDDFELNYQKSLEADKTQGISYIISGSIALVGGLAGNGVTSDPLEKGVYAIFQTIGVASIGFGAYKWQIGDDNRLLIQSLKYNDNLSNGQKLSVLKSIEKEKGTLKEKEKLIKAITHGMIAALNFYNASLQKNSSVKNGLYFIGTANALASISYSF